MPTCRSFDEVLLAPTSLAEKLVVGHKRDTWAGKQGSWNAQKLKRGRNYPMSHNKHLA
jgi:hypothetical protein